MAIDIMQLVDKLEALLERGKRMPFTSSVLVDEQSFADIIKQMRISLPEEIKLARRVYEQREQVIAAAQQEADSIVAQAHQDGSRLLEDHEIRRQAQEHGARLLDEAQRQALATRLGADEYAADMLLHLSEELAALQKTIGNGLSTLDRRRRVRDGRAGSQNKPPAE
jgi:vacuolar-type H+-ATPase subunit H